MANNAILLVNLGEKMNRYAPYGADYAWEAITGSAANAEGTLVRSRNPLVRIDRIQEPIRNKIPQLIATAPRFDICHEYVCDEKLLSIWEVMTELAPWHQYMIRTQFPQRLLELQTSLKWTPNLWIGVPLRTSRDVELLEILKSLPIVVKFATLLPPREDLSFLDFSGLDWVIAGGSEDQRLKIWYHDDWIEALYQKSREQKIPFYFAEAGKYVETNRDRTYHFSEVRQLPFKSEWIDYYRQLDKVLTISDGESWGWREPFPETMKTVRQRRQRSIATNQQPVIPEIIEEPNSAEQPTLSLEQQREALTQLEQIINKSVIGYFATGEALAKIRDAKLYRAAGFRSFSKYCKERFSMSRIHGYRLIAQYHMNQFFVTHGLHILPERQTRLLRGIPPEEALTLVKDAQNTTAEGFLSFNDSLESVVEEYRQNHIQQSSNDIASDGTFYCRTLKRRVQYCESIPTMIAELSMGKLDLAIKLVAEFSQIKQLGKLNHADIAEAVLAKHSEIEIAEFGKAMGMNSIEVHFEVDELGF